jgi:hypothetical protein
MSSRRCTRRTSKCLSRRQVTAREHHACMGPPLPLCLSRFSCHRHRHHGAQSPDERGPGSRHVRTPLRETSLPRHLSYREGGAKELLITTAARLHGADMYSSLMHRRHTHNRSRPAGRSRGGRAVSCGSCYYLQRLVFDSVY